MKKRFVLLFWVITFGLVSQSTTGQHSISGRVIDLNTGSSLPGAHINLKGKETSTVADNNGFFKFAGLQDGHYTLKVSFIGYLTAEENIQLTQDMEVTIKLEQTSILADEIVVSATRATDRSPTTYENISSEDIRRQNLGKDLPFLLETTPSLVVTSDAGNGVGYTNMRLRGSDLTRINVTINGVPLNDPESHGVWFVDMPDFASSIDNIQIQRGVGTSSNGAAAFGASINIQTEKPTVEPTGEVNLGYGSFNTYKRNLKFITGLIDGKWSFNGRISKITSDGYIDRATSDLSSLFVSGGYHGEKTQVKFNVIKGYEKTYQAWMGISREVLDTNRTYNPMGRYTTDNGEIKYYENQTDNYWQDHYHLILNQEVSRYLMLNATLFYIKGKGYYEEYHDKNDPFASTAFSSYGLEDVIIGGDTIQNTNLIRQLWLDNDFYGGVFSLNYDQPGKIYAVFGGGINFYEGDHFGKVIWAEYASNSNNTDKWYENTGLKNDFNIYGKIIIPVLDNWNVYADLQYRYIDYKIDGPDKNFRDLTQTHTFSFINPKIGISRQFKEKHKVYSSFAISNREPNRYNFTGAEPEKPSPEHETLRNVEAGYSFVNPRIKLNSNVFYMNYKNQLVLNGQLNDVGSPVMENVPSSYRMGLEISAAIKLAERFNWLLNGSISQNKIFDYTDYVVDYDYWPVEYVKTETGTTNIAFSPEFTGNSNITWECYKNLKISLISKYTGKQFIDNTSSEERKLDPYFVNDIALSYIFSLKYIKNVSLLFRINNVLDEKYESNAWIFRYYSGGGYYEDTGLFPQAGIHFMTGLNINF
ncbi:MAG: TonB-dependent receptor [Bacteroidales bacterium]|nr:TonB-dependent receptor [Bacteroidales bacterium]